MPRLCSLLCLLAVSLAPAHADEDIVIEGAQAETKPAQLLDCSAEASLKSERFDIATRVEFVNTSDAQRRTYWIDYDGKRVLYRTLAPGESYTQQTYATHPWVMTDAQEQCVVIYVPDAAPGRVVIP
jgi:von Hippel-Lindau disease tumor supressor